MVKSEGRRKLPVLLLIDDDLVSREVTATVLTMSGYTVHTANDGAGALQMLAGRDCEPDVVLMDAQMPGLSGAALVGKLRTHTKARIFVISGSNAPDNVAASADGFLMKPFDAQTLQRLLGGEVFRDGRAASSHLDPDQPVISTEILAQFRGMMPAGSVREIYSAVVADLGKRAKALEAAIARGDDGEIRRIGHAIKGGCGMAGALQAASLGALFEAIPADNEGNQLDDRMALLADLRAAARNLKRMLDAEI